MSLLPEQEQKRMKIYGLRAQIGSVLKLLLGTGVGISFGLLITYFAGEDPFFVLGVLLRSAFGSRYDLGMTLFYATPLILTGLSVAFAFHAGLFNIGAEGQLALGALAVALVGVSFPDEPRWMVIGLALVTAFGLGASWGAVPGWLRARYGAHEVITTIMFNFIASGVCSWIVLHFLRDVHSHSPQTVQLPADYLFLRFPYFRDAPVTVTLLVALLAAVGVWLILWKTVLGYEIRAVGQSEAAAQVAGIQVGKVRILAMGIAGGLAGLVGVCEVLGNTGRFKIDFSPGYGFMGIAVALLGRNQPFGVVMAGLFFGALHKGSMGLDLETEKITRDLSQLLQAFVILSVSVEELWDRLGLRIQKLFSVSFQK